ncbi:FAD binding domain-containing protein [Christiangramia forsetii]|uniref:Molybdenum-dependent oxidoreductase FAD-binding subunit n=2 Tax=Christiangramia forsetii TaxID=411153 RepID=A0LYI0_CHRFK|nr:xanthine dehydrogenase family protein subunit M [Christiangramia forsetii]GGG34170.1 FAD-binding molybdopterin dehydrogenase [Christiangramia forsetii]CAL65425.1 molybdenum-dependent oxidoreductase FAD-binding subunit [Christiangramia forsetii KT0803]
MRPFTYTDVENKDQALNAYTETSHYLGGGTNLVDLMKEDVERPDQLIDLQKLDYKKITSNENGGLTLGSLLSNSETANHPEIRKKYPLLSMAMLSAATAQIRNMATNGGNLLQSTRCPYFYETSMPCNKREPGSGCGALDGMNGLHAIFGYSDKCIAVNPSDMNVALAAIGAEVEVFKPNGDSRMIPFSDFHRLPGDQPQKDNNLEPGELITAIHLSDPVFSDHYYYLKIRERSSYAFALISVAVGLQIKGGTITKTGLAMGGVAHKPWKLTKAEEFLAGKAATLTNFEKAADLAMREAKPFEDNKYKVEMGKKAIVRALSQAFERKI